jgi:hypothetical protein
LFTAAPVLTAVATAGLLASGALVILQSRRPSVLSFIGHNAALWGGIVAGGLASLAILGSGTATDIPWLVLIMSGVRNWVSSTVLGSAAMIAIHRATVGKGGKAERPLIASAEGERPRPRSIRQRVLGWLNVWRRSAHREWSWTPSISAYFQKANGSSA